MYGRRSARCKLAVPGYYPANRNTKLAYGSAPVPRLYDSKDKVSSRKPHVARTDPDSRAVRYRAESTCSARAPELNRLAARNYAVRQNVRTDASPLIRPTTSAKSDTAPASPKINANRANPHGQNKTAASIPLQIGLPAAVPNPRRKQVQAAYKGLSGIPADEHEAFLRAVIAIQTAPSPRHGSLGAESPPRLLRQRGGTIPQFTGHVKISFSQISENRGAFRIRVAILRTG